LWLLGVGGVMAVWWRRAEKGRSRADVFFGLWLVIGTVFHFCQMHIALHYLATLAPAYAYFAARLVQVWMGEGVGFGIRQALAGAVLAVACVGQVARFGYGMKVVDETDYWQTVAYFRESVPREARVMGASYIDLSLPQKSYDLYRYIQTGPFNDGARDLAATVDQFRISYLVLDPEWYTHNLPDGAEFLRERCTRVARMGRYEVMVVEPATGGSRAMGSSKL